MPVLKFSLTPDATSKVYEILVCLAKFGEAVSIEARSDKLTLTSLNLSKTAYASFALDATTFFTNYDFGGRDRSKSGNKFTCQLMNRALQSVFKGRTGDFRGRDNAVERCDVSIQDQPDKTECRLVVRMVCKHGMTKTYRLTYESAEVMHALFDKAAATQGWKISARVLREYAEFFGPKTEQLDVVASEGKAVFTSFTEKIQDGKEVLKQPLETAISIHTEDFDDFHMQENMHIVTSVKDFKAIVTHAETLRSTITAYFSFPSRPLQFSYQSPGIQAEFTLMTSGDLRGAASAPEVTFVSTRASTQQTSFSAAPSQSRPATDMPPPSRPALSKPLGSQSQRASEQTSTSAREDPDEDHDSLFVPARDEDNTWDPQSYENAEEEEMLGWDASNNNPSASFHPTFRDSGSVAQPPRPPPASDLPSQEGLEPTQRLSQLHGMFD